MTKEKFAAQLAKEMRSLGVKMTVPSAEKFVNALAKSMADGLIRDRKLIVSNFGSFESIKIGAKVINSPKGDNKKFFMPPTDIIKWHPSGKIRERAQSFEIDDSEFEQIKGRPMDEDLKAVLTDTELPAESIEEKLIHKVDPYEVKVKYIRGDAAKLSNSPISKLIKSLLKEMLSKNATSMKITPQRFASQIVYISGETQSEKILPRENHDLIIGELANLTGGESEFMLFGTERVKMKKNLTPFGTELVIISIK